MSVRPLAIVIVMSFCVGGSVAQKDSTAAAIHTYLQPYAQSGNFAGDVLVVKSGKVIFEKAYGFADREHHIRNTAATRFHIASMSMQFTAAAVLRLVDTSSIKLDDRVGGFVPGIQGADKITIRDLLTQRSGLPDINALANYDNVLQHHQTPSSLIAEIEGRPLLFEPGSKFLHEEHSAYNLLALIVEKKTGLPFAAAMQKLVFRPAGLSNSSIDDDALPSGTGVAEGYQPEGVEGLKQATSIHWSAKTGNASAVTAARDQAQFLRAVFGGRLLKAPSRNEILDPSPRVGYGWMRSASERYHETIYYMNGRAPGFSSFVMCLPREQLIVIVFSNIYSSATTTIGYDLAAISLGLPYEPFLPGESAVAEQLHSYAGTFEFGPDFYQPNAEVSLIDDGSMLSMRWPSGDISPLIPLERDRFVDRSYWEEIRVERDAAGSPRSILYGHFRGIRKQ